MSRVSRHDHFHLLSLSSVTFSSLHCLPVRPLQERTQEEQADPRTQRPHLQIGPHPRMGRRFSIRGFEEQRL
eukprot:SAG11_NODE_830_length_6956_cov_11.233484_10_plen_72_part_00